MPSKNEDLQKHTLNLRRGDYQTLIDAYEGRPINASYVIQTIVSAFVDKLKKKISDEQPKLEIEIDKELFND